jgi:hypothetical protein
MESTVTAEIGADDSFRLERVPAGRYRVELWGHDAFVKSLRLGAVETEGDILDVRNGAGGGALTLMLSTATGDIEGTVRDSKGPVAGAMVLVMRDAGGFSSSTVTDAGGRYLLPGLRPGTYKLLAADDRTGALFCRSVSRTWGITQGRSRPWTYTRATRSRRI